MCWKKIAAWFNGTPEVPQPPLPEGRKKIALLFAIGTGYPGVQNDLVGPPYDLKNVTAFFCKCYKEFIVKVFADAQITRYFFETTIRYYISLLKPDDELVIYYSGHGTNGIDKNEVDGYREGLYLVDGTYWDDEFSLLLQDIPKGARVTVVLDSCFAKGSTIPKHVINRKFVETQPIPQNAKRVKQILKSEDMNYVIYAACGENQTSADLGTDGGAFTMYWLKAWDRAYTHLQWSSQTAKLLTEDNSLDQVPNIDGNMELMNKVIFV